MGTRFLLTAESPVPEETAKRYFAAAVTDVTVTTEVDGLPQRVIRNELVQRLESSGRLTAFLRALRSGLAYRKMSGDCGSIAGFPPSVSGFGRPCPNRYPRFKARSGDLRRAISRHGGIPVRRSRRDVRNGPCRCGRTS